MSSAADSVQRSPTEATAATPGYQGPHQEATEHQSSAEEMEEPVAASTAKNSEEIKESGVEAGDDKSDDEEDAAAPKEGDMASVDGGDGASATAPPAQNNLIINYLPSHITENELRNMFAVHGDLAHVKVVYDRSTGKSMGYGFVKFTTNEAAAAATAAINGMAIDRKRIKVSVARPSSKDIKNSKLYVTNLPDHFNQDQVIEVFQQFGKIIECRTLVDPKTTISRCTAFVQFDTRREAKDALKFMNGHSLPGAKKALLVKFAEDHHRRIQRQEMAQNGKGGRGMDGSQGGGGHYSNQQGHYGKGKSGRKGRGGRGGGGGGSGMMYRNNNQHIGPRQHGGHMNPGYLNAMGMQATNPDGSPIGQGMIGRFGMQVPGGPVSAATAAQQAAAFHAAQQVPAGYGMMQLNQAMGMMSMGGAAAAAAAAAAVAGGGAAGARDGIGSAPGDGSGSVVAGGAFGLPGGAMGGGAGGAGGGGTATGGVGRTSMMRGEQQQHGMHQHMMAPQGYATPPGAAIAYVNEMKNVSSSLSGGGGPVAPVKHHHQGGDRGAVEQSHHPHHNPQQQQQPPNNHGQGFIMRGV